MQRWIAHVTDTGETQTVQQHLAGAAELARCMAETFGCGKWAHVAALWHDLGKYSRQFQRRILDNGPRVDHSTAGAQHAAGKLGDPGKILAYAIAGHHAGLPDGKTSDASSLHNRLEKNVPDFSACPDAILNHDCEFTPDQVPISLRHPGFSLSLFIRMLFSCVVDADRLDTELFTKPEQAEQRGGCPSLPELEEKLNAHLDNLTASAPDTLVNRVRANVLAQCRAAASLDPGLFSLTVPTGGGKTLSSLAFALRHAIVHGHQRVIYVIPFTSIIEQNATVFRDALGERAVLEHHCNFDPPKKQEDDSDQLTWHELATENWDAPVVVTTNVQFFESLFSARPSNCRKLHNIANSVVILDEAQMLPAPLLRPCLAALHDLAANYRTSVVLCTATQPALTKGDDFPGGLDDVLSLIHI